MIDTFINLIMNVSFRRRLIATIFVYFFAVVSLYIYLFMKMNFSWMIQEWLIFAYLFISHII